MKLDSEAIPIVENRLSYIYNYIIDATNIHIIIFIGIFRQKSTPKGLNMFKLWVRLIKENHLVKDTVIADDTNDTRTHKVFNSIDKACYEFDLGRPIWLDSTVKDFKAHSKARFTTDSFIEQVDFDYMEIQILEED